MSQKTGIFTVNAVDEAGTGTNLRFKPGTSCQIFASGEVGWDPGRDVVGPGGAGFTDPNATSPTNPVAALLVQCGTIYSAVGDGSQPFRFFPPTPDQLIFLMNDGRGEYGNNRGAFQVTVNYDDSDLT